MIPNAWLCISLAFLIVFKDIDKAVLQINPPWVFADVVNVVRRIG